ncbi:hypothetical protein ACHQM5_019113 [Ranunculus cassubicifolius]
MARQKRKIGKSAPSVQNQTSSGTDLPSTEVIQTDASTNVTQEQESEVTENLPPQKRRLTSPVWNDFERKEIDGIFWAYCKKCHRRLKAVSRSGTKHLHNHLNLHCPLRTIAGKRQQTIGFKETTDGKLLINNFNFDQETSREDLSKAICLHEYPLSIVEHIGFRNFVHRLQPLFQMPKSRNTIKSDILKLFQSEKSKLYKVFDNHQSRISITTDMWTSRQKKGYMAVTAHFIDEEWCMNNVIIGLVTFSVSNVELFTCTFSFYF